MQIISLKRGAFELKATILGKGIPTLVIGSHIYYPKIFSKKLQAHLQLIFEEAELFDAELLAWLDNQNLNNIR